MTSMVFMVMMNVSQKKMVLMLLSMMMMMMMVFLLLKTWKLHNLVPRQSEVCRPRWGHCLGVVAREVRGRRV